MDAVSQCGKYKPAPGRELSAGGQRCHICAAPSSSERRRFDSCVRYRLHCPSPKHAQPKASPLFDRPRLASQIAVRQFLRGSLAETTEATAQNVSLVSNLLTTQEVSVTHQCYTTRSWFQTRSCPPPILRSELERRPL